MTVDPEADDSVEDGDTIEELLLSAGIVEETPAGNDLRLTDEFESTWHQLSKQMRDSDRVMRWFARTRNVSRERVEATTDGELFVIEIDGSVVGKWPSAAAFLAETVVRPTLRKWLPESEYERLSADLLRELSTRLLLFLERCPSCDGELAFADEDDAESARVSLSCTACEATLFSGTHE